MGLGLTRDGKKIVCASATIYRQLRGEITGGVIFDVNAMFRKHGVYPQAVTPKTAVRMFFNRLVDPYPKCKFVGFYCDTSSKVPEERIRFLSEDRYAKTSRPPTQSQVNVDGRNYTKGTEPVCDAMVNLITADSMPASWTRVWASAKGKARLWDQICTCIIDYIGIRAVDGVQYIVAKPSGEMWGYPAQPTAPTHHYGEADAKCAEAAKEMADAFPDQLFLVVTIDWDMLISAMFFPPNVAVHISNVFLNPDDPESIMVHSKAKAPKSWVSTPEIINSGDLGPYGRTRASRAWWILATAGVDYCAGLRAFGFKEKAMLAILTSFDASPSSDASSDALSDVRVNLVDISTESHTVTFNVTACLRILAPIKRKLIKSDTVADFNIEMDRIWFCLLYYMGYEPQRQPRGGPIRTHHEWIPSRWGTTLTEVFQSPHYETVKDRFIWYVEPHDHADPHPRYRLSA
jgi:hypothetical protein